MKKKFYIIVNLILIFLILHSLLNILGKYFLYIGKPEKSKIFFKISFNKKGLIHSLAINGDLNEAENISKGNKKLEADLNIYMQDFDKAYEISKKISYKKGEVLSLIGKMEYEKAYKLLSPTDYEYQILNLKSKYSFISYIDDLNTNKDYFSLALIFLYLNDYPSFIYYLKRDGSLLADAYCNLILGRENSKNNIFEKALSPLTKKCNKAQIAKDNFFTPVNYFISGEYEAYFKFIETNKVNHFVSALPEYFVSQEKPIDRIKILNFISKKFPSVWIQPKITDNLVSLNKKSKTYGFSLIILQLTILTSFILLLFFIYKMFSNMIIKKQIEKHSIEKDLKEFPTVERKADKFTDSHSWDITQINSEIENDVAVLKKVFEKLKIEYDPDELRYRITNAKIKNKAYKIYSIASQFNLYAKLSKISIDEFDKYLAKGIVLVIFNDNSLHLYVKKEENLIHLFDGQMVNKYEKNKLKDNLWNGQIVILNKI